MKKQQQTQNKKKEKTHLAFAMVFILLSVILSSTVVFAQLAISINSQINVLELGTNQFINLTITSNASISSAKIEINGQNQSLITNGTYYYYNWTPGIGINIYKIYVDNINFEQSNLTNQFTVQDTTPPNTIGYGPNGYLQSSLVEIKIITNENSTCRYDFSDMTYSSMRYNLTGNETEHLELKTLSDGSYNYYARCKDLNLNEGQTKKLSFTVDTSLPQITIVGPIGTQTYSPVNIRLITNEQATCKWSNSMIDYDSMQNTFTITSSIIHDQEVSLNEGLNPFYVICKDLAGNKNSVLPVNIDYNNPPSAKITIEKIDGYSILKNGIYRVDLLASKALSQVPTLSLECSGNNFNIPLQGLSRDWFGYLIIPDNSYNCAADFSYQGIDQHAAIGTLIEDGKIVLIDSRKPIRPSNVKAIVENNKIRLSWVDEGGYSDYKIYRSTTGTTDQNNYLGRIDQTIYLDSNIQNKIGYFYKVSSVSKSGVESDLSDEIFIMADLNQTIKFVQDPQIKNLLDEQLDYIQRVINDIDITMIKISDDNSIENNILIKMNAKNQLELSKNNLQSLIGELKVALESRITIDEASQKVKTIAAKVDSEKRKMISKVDVLEKTDFEQDNGLFSDDEIQKLYDVRSLSALQLQKYLSDIQTLNSNSRINQKAALYKITMFDGSQRQGVYLSKKIVSVADPLTIWIQDVVPQNVIKLSQVNLDPSPDDINQYGPIWKGKNIPDGEIVYLYEFNDDLQTNLKDLKVKTLLIRDLNAFILENNISVTDQITGNVVKSSKSDLTLIYATIIMGLVSVSLIIYYLFSMKGIKLYKGFSSYENEDLNELFSLLADARLSLAGGEVEEARQIYTTAHAKYLNLKIGLIKKMKVNLEFHSLHADLEKEISLKKEESETKHLYS